MIRLFAVFPFFKMGSFFYFLVLSLMLLCYIRKFYHSHVKHQSASANISLIKQKVVTDLCMQYQSICKNISAKSLYSFLGFIPNVLVYLLMKFFAIADTSNHFEAFVNDFLSDCREIIA